MKTFDIAEYNKNPLAYIYKNPNRSAAKSSALSLYFDALNKKIESLDDAADPELASFNLVADLVKSLDKLI